MPPRVCTRSTKLPLLIRKPEQYVCFQCRHASLAAATVPAATPEQILKPVRQVPRYPAVQPPSLKRPEFRKTQLHRQYQSLIRSSPMILLFQHNNMKSAEWVAIQRELKFALKKVDQELAKNGSTDDIGSITRLQVVQTGIFASALRVVEFWYPRFDDNKKGFLPGEFDPAHPPRPALYTHGLSWRAWKAGKHTRKTHGLEALMSGPIAALSLPTVSPQHVKVALSILAPGKDIPAPKRKVQPSLYDDAAQLGLQKLMLLGARIEGKAFDFEGARWVAGIDGGLDGLRAQLVAMLQGIGGTLTSTLESAGKNLYMTMEGRRSQLEEEQKNPEA